MSILRTGLAAAAALLPWLVPATGNAGSLVTLYSFSGGADGGMPYAPLLLRDGELFGTTLLGGTSGYGTVFRLDTATQAETVIYSFTGGADGGEPDTGLAIRGNWLWGTAATGGAAKAGTLFKLDRRLSHAPRVFSLPGGTGGAQPASRLLNLGNALYGLTNTGGASGVGTLFKLDPNSGAETVLHSFTKTDGAYPLGDLAVQGSTLLGTTSYAGAGGYGTVFQLDPATGQTTVLYSFKGGKDGGSPQAGLIAGGGYVYGTTPFYGAGGRGTLFRIDPVTGAETLLHAFSAAEGSPTGPLAMKGSTIFGTTDGGGAGAGTIFRFDTASQDEKTVYAFSGTGDGYMPNGLAYAGGAFYGTTQFSTTGTNQPPSGTVFKFVP